MTKAIDGGVCVTYVRVRCWLVPLMIPKTYLCQIRVAEKLKHLRNPPFSGLLPPPSIMRQCTVHQTPALLALYFRLCLSVPAEPPLERRGFFRVELNLLLCYISFASSTQLNTHVRGQFKLGICLVSMSGVVSRSGQHIDKVP